LRLTHQLLATRGLSDYPKGPIDPSLLRSLHLSMSAIDDVLARIGASADQLDGMARAAVG